MLRSSLKVVSYDLQQLVTCLADLLEIGNELLVTLVVHLLDQELRIPQYVPQRSAHVMREMWRQLVLNRSFDVRGKIGQDVAPAAAAPLLLRAMSDSIFAIRRVSSMGFVS